MDGITILVAYSLLIVGRYDDLESLAKLIISTVLDVEVLVIRYQNGWRLLLICRDSTALSSVYSLVDSRIQSGVTMSVTNGRNPMVTRIYSTT